MEAGRLAVPPGLETGYAPHRQGVSLDLDSRRPRPEPGRGVPLELDGEHVFDLDDAARRRWIRWGGTLGGFVDLTGHNRVVALALTTLFADPLGEGAIPFTNLASLGGDDLMRGHLAGRRIGRSAAVATLEYRHPIWVFADGSVQAAVGHVFGEHLEGFDTERVRLSFAASIRTSGSRDHSFKLLVGAGTETFAEGAALESARFVFGATRGF